MIGVLLEDGTDKSLGALDVAINNPSLDALAQANNQLDIQALLCDAVHYEGWKAQVKKMAPAVSMHDSFELCLQNGGMSPDRSCSDIVEDDNKLIDADTHEKNATYCLQHRDVFIGTCRSL